MFYIFYIKPPKQEKRIFLKFYKAPRSYKENEIIWKTLKLLDLLLHIYVNKSLALEGFIKFSHHKIII